MTWPPERFVALLDAVARAAAVEVAAEVLSGVAMRSHELLVALETSDTEPMVSIRDSGAAPGTVDHLLESREASGPDRWDYAHTMSCLGDRLVLRLSRGGATCDVPLVPAAAAIFHMHGWRDDPGLLAPALVALEDLTAALAMLTTTTGSR